MRDLIDPKIKEIFDKKEFYKPLIKDREFRKFWKQERAQRLENQKDCLYCSIPFTSKNPAVLHHREMPQSKSQSIRQKKASIILDLAHKKITLDEAKKKYEIFISELNEYYRTLKDTDLICTSCHAKQHPYIARSSRQRKL